MRKPLPHQIEPIKRLKENKKFGLFLAPGLGKTYITTKHWYDNKFDKDLLVITKGSVLPEWPSSIKKDDLDIEIVWLNKGSKKNKEIIQQPRKDKPRMFLISLQSSWRLTDTIMKVKKNSMMVIFDESHNVKEFGSAVGKYARMVLSLRFEDTILLTGTPISKANNMDLFNQIRIIRIDDLRVKTKKAFMENFLETEVGYNGNFTFKKIIGNKNDSILKEIMKPKTLFMTRKESGVKFEKAVEKYIDIEQDKEVLQAMKDRVYGNWMLQNTISKISNWRTMCSGFVYSKDKFGKRIVDRFKKQNKINELKEILRVHQEEQVVVYYNFSQELEDIREATKSHNMNVTRVTSKERDLTGNVIAIQYGSAAEGLNLQEYGMHVMVFYSPVTIGYQFLQSKLRIDRIGQKYNVFFYKFRVKDSVEEKIWERLENTEDFTEELFEKEYE